MQFSEENLLGAGSVLEPFKYLRSLYVSYEAQSMAKTKPSKSLKISLLRQKDDSTPQVRHSNFYLAVFNTYI